MKKLKLNSKITPKKYYLILLGTYLIQVAIAALLVILCFFVLPISLASGSYLFLYILIPVLAGLVAVAFTMTYRYAIAKINTSGIADLVLFFLLNVLGVFMMALAFGAAYQAEVDNHHNNFIMPLEDPLNWLFLFFLAAATICILGFLAARFRTFFDKTWKYLGASPVIVLCIILVSRWLPHHDLITNIYCVSIAIIFSLIGGYELFQATKCKKTIYNAIDNGISLFLDTAAVMVALGTTKNDD